MGIGTTSPQRTLSVAGYIRSASDASETNYIELWHGGSHGFINKEGIGDLDFRLNGISRLTLADDGLLQVKGPAAKVATPNGDSDQWNSAYGWGNHNDAGYVISGANATLGTINSGSITSSGILSAHGLSTSSNLYMNDFSIQNFRNLRMQDFDDDTGGSDNKYRLLARDGAFQFNNGGVVVGGYGDNTWTDLADGTLIIKEGLAIGQTSIEAGYDADINGNVRVRGTMVSGVIGSSNEKLVLQTSGVDAITINNTTQKVTTHADLNVLGEASITGNLNIIGDLVYGQGINNDPQAPKLLALDAHNKMVYHKLNDVRNPWSLRFVRNVFGTGVDCMEITDSTGLVVQVDILDIHGNLLLGNNGYIDDRDDELSAEDQIWAGDHDNLRDDWIHIAERIELSSNSSVGEGVVIFGKNTTSTQFLNLTQDGNDSYLANSSGLSEYFLKATDRNVILGGNLTMPVGSTATVETISINQNATITGQISTISHGNSAEWNSAFTSRVVAGSGLSWNSSTKDLSINTGTGLTFNASDQLELDNGSISIASTQVTGLPWNLSGGVLTYTGNAKVSADFEAQNLKLTGLSVGDKSLDKVMVISSDGTVKSIASSELGGDSPWGTQDTGIGYTGTVDVDGTVITSSLQITALPKANGYDRVLVEDGTGMIGYKDLSTFDLSPWTKDINDNLSYNTGNISTTKTMISDVATNEVAFIARGAGEDNFRVYGNGDIKARDLVLDQVSWPDYVFKDDYELKPIEEVEAFVKENKHLPDVPSEDEILENGMSVGEMNKVLLQKVEELTLYIIEQNKTIKQQKEDFAARLAALEQKIGQ